MPFDGMNFELLDEIEIGVARPSRVFGWRHWLKVIGLWRAPEPLEPLDQPGEVVRLLAEARELIAEDDRWAQGAFWRYPNRRCAMGALRFVARKRNDLDVAASAYSALVKVARSRGYLSVERMNDNSSHGEVLTAFDEAIQTVRDRRL